MNKGFWKFIVIAVVIVIAYAFMFNSADENESLNLDDGYTINPGTLLYDDSSADDSSADDSVADSSTPDFSEPDESMPDDSSSPEPTPTPTPTPTPETVSRWLKRSQLTAVEKQAYDDMYDALITGQTTVKITLDIDYVETSLNKLRDAVLDDHPEIFWLNGAYYAEWKTVGRLANVELEMGVYEYLAYKSSLQKYVNSVNSKANAVVAEASKLGTDYEKVLFVHDWLVQNNQYAYDWLEETEKTNHDAKYEIIRSAYSALVEGKTVCAGYAKAFKLILDRLGINNIYVTGDAGGPHAWSSVELDGEWYIFDVTWDDPIEGKSLFVCYDYFGITDKILSVDHTADESLFTYPDCVSDYYNYYTYNGLRYDTYDRDQINADTASMKGDGIILAFSNVQAYNAAVKDLSDDNNWYELDAVSHFNRAYVSPNDEQLTISIYKA